MADVEVVYEGGLRTRCTHMGNKAEIITDAPRDNHGKGEVFSPTDLIAAALGSCVLTLMGIMADRLKVDITGSRLFVQKEMAAKPSRRIGKLTVSFKCPRDFDSDIKEKLQQAGEYCPVHHSLHPDIEQIFSFEWGSAP